MRIVRASVIGIATVMVASLSAVTEAGLAHAARGSADRPAAQAGHYHPAATPAPLPAGHSWTVTLLTGDVVHVRTVRGRPPIVIVTPGDHRERTSFAKFVDNRGDIEVYPLDVAPLIGRVLDPALFNVTTLIQNGDDDARRSFLPLIVQGSPAGTAALPSLVTRGPALTSIGAVAAIERRSAAVRVGRALAAMASAVTRSGRVSPQVTGGTRYVWLDRTIRLDDAMPVRALLRAEEARRGAVLDRNLVQIGAPFAWRHGDTGAGIKVAVLDTGVDATFPDLRGQIAAERNFSSSHPRVVTDLVGHGTFVASLIAGTGRAAGGERRGVAFGSRLVIGKVFDNQGIGLESWAIAGMQWAATRARVVNMSFSGSLPTSGPDPMAQAVNSLTATDRVLFVAAADNNGPSDESIGTPATANAALAVGAVDGHDRLAYFSGRGPVPGNFAMKPEITAPGVNIIGARAPGTFEGIPIDARYTVASGTSFSTPETAGAAAILAGMHPGWSPARIKADLVSTAQRATGGDYYAVGGGLLDIAAAVSDQVAAATAIADAGRAAISGNPVRTNVRWASTSSRKTTITLTATLTDHFGHRVPAGTFALTAGRLNVPAHGTASADLIIRPRALAKRPGIFEGQIVARYGTVTIKTPISFFLNPPSYALTVSSSPPPGSEPSGYSTFAVVVDLSDPDILVNTLGTSNNQPGTMRVPAGRYWVVATVSGSNASGTQQQAIVGYPEVTINRNTALRLDAAHAEPVTATVPGVPTIAYDGGLHAERDFAGQAYAVDVNWFSQFSPPTVMFLKVSGSAHTGSFRAYSWFRLSNPTSSKTYYVYDLYHLITGPASAAYQITPAERAKLVKLTVHFYAIDGNTAPVYDTRYGITQSGYLAVEDDGGPVPGGSTRIDYVSGGPEITWDQEAVPPIYYKGKSQGLAWVTEVPNFTSYVPGSKHVLDWVREPFVPGPYSGAPSVSFCAPLPTMRVRGYIYAEFDDLQNLPDGFDCLGGPGQDDFWAKGTSREMRLYLGGKLIGSTPNSFATFKVPPQPGTYRLTYSTSIGAVLPISTSTLTTWTFRSAAPDLAGQQTHIPLLLIRYHLPLNLDNHPDGSTAILTVTRVGGTPRATVNGLWLWTSLDGGKTWQPAPVRALGGGQFAATLPHAAAGQAVSLRVQASDAGGSKIDQTIIAAYHG